jgi:hypothetical protein
MLLKIITGTAPGAEQAARRAAESFGVPVVVVTREGGEALPPHDDGPLTEGGARQPDATLWFGRTTTPAAWAAIASCQRLARPCLPVYPEAAFEPGHVVDWLRENVVKILEVAGNHESDEPGIGERVERFLAEVLKGLGHEQN